MLDYLFLCISPTMQTLQLPETIKIEHYPHILEAKWVRRRYRYVLVLAQTVERRLYLLAAARFARPVF